MTEVRLEDSPFVQLATKIGVCYVRRAAIVFIGPEHVPELQDDKRPVRAIWAIGGQTTVILDTADNLTKLGIGR